MSGSVTVAAVDLGASSGRVLVGTVGEHELRTAEVHRFPNGPVRVADTLYWDVLGIYREVLAGLRAAGRLGSLDSIGIDSWAVDYGLLDADGALLGNPVHYRDKRTEDAAEKMFDLLGAQRLYAATGLQFLPFNTIFQLATEVGGSRLGMARRLLMIPDLLSYWLTGSTGTEYTNASTTGLLNVRSRRWATDLLHDVGLPPSLLGGLRHPGDPAGRVLPEVAAECGFTEPVAVTAVASHDTASAVVAVPAADDRFAYISCGTWSLVGVELTAPVLTEESRQANFTNEGGVDGTIRYLRNVMGLWLLQECLRHWRDTGQDIDLDTLLRDAARLPGLRAVIDPDDPIFLPPGDMPQRVKQWCRETGQPEPANPAEVARCILDSLALAHRATLIDAQRLSGKQVDAVHIVGGGARNTLLCQLTADASGLPVVAGPTEATALGNVLVQARAAGAISGGLAELRALVRNTQPLRRFRPDSNQARWSDAAARIAAR